MDDTDIVTTLRRESFYCPVSRINNDGKAQLGFELMSINLQAADEIERLRKERDEARREVCVLMQRTGFLRGDYADERGWDCYNTPKAKVDKTLKGVIIDGGKAVPPKYEGLGDEHL